MLLGIAVTAVFALGLVVSGGHAVDRATASVWWIAQNLFGGEEGARQAVEQQRREGLVKTITTMAQMHGRNEFDSMAVRMSNDAFKIAFDLQRGAITPERASDLMSALGAVRDSESRKVQERLTPETAADLLSSMPARARELHDGMTFPAPVGIKAKIVTWLAENPVAKRRMEMRGRQAHAAESERASKDGRGKLPDTGKCWISGWLVGRLRSVFERQRCRYERLLGGRCCH